MLNIEKKKDEQKLITEEVNDTVLDHIMSGVDVISGKRGKQYFQVSESVLLQFIIKILFSLYLFFFLSYRIGLNILTRTIWNQFSATQTLKTQWFHFSKIWLYRNTLFT